MRQLQSMMQQYNIPATLCAYITPTNFTEFLCTLPVQVSTRLIHSIWTTRAFSAEVIYRMIYHTSTAYGHGTARVPCCALIWYDLCDLYTLPYDLEDRHYQSIRHNPVMCRRNRSLHVRRVNTCDIPCTKYCCHVWYLSATYTSELCQKRGRCHYQVSSPTWYIAEAVLFAQGKAFCVLPSLLQFALFFRVIT